MGGSIIKSTEDQGHSTLFLSAPGTVECSQHKKHPIRFARRVNGETTEISVIMEGGQRLGVYGILPRLMTSVEAKSLHRTEAHILTRSVCLDKEGRSVQVVEFAVPGDVAKILEDAAYVEPYSETPFN